MSARGVALAGAAAARSAIGRAAAAVILCTPLVIGCAPAPIAVDTPRIVRGHALAPYAIHEECLHAAPGQRIDFDFQASNPVDFNLHYRDGNTVVMPIVREKSREEAGVFTPRLERDYCLMWEAGASGALIDYRIGLRR